ncbi:MAG: AAA family ATPase [Actinomycetota bacterium]
MHPGRKASSAKNRESRLLHNAYERAVEERSCHLFTVLGSAGVGKSRLTSEFLTAVSPEALIAEGRCLSYGEGITFHALREAVKRAAGIDEGDGPGDVVTKLEKLVLEVEDRPALTEPLAQMMGFTSGAATTDEIFWAVRRLFETLARERPLVAARRS